MKACSEDRTKQQFDSHKAQAQKLSARLERSCTPQWTSNTEYRNDSKGAQLGRSRAATLGVETRLKGNRKLLEANPDVSAPLAKVACECRLRGSRRCTVNCPCLTRWKSCGGECECHGCCCNSFFDTPRLSIRSGALGEELYTKSDLPRYRIAFVVCGKIMTVPEYWRYHEKLMHRTVRHYGFTVSWPGHDHGLPGDPDLDKYVVDPFKDMTGAVNHSCVPNVVLEACWANGKFYAVGRTTRDIMAKEALTVDYKWKGTSSAREFAEICLCRETLCRGLIAEEGGKFLEASTSYYEGEITRLQEQLVFTEKALQQRYENLAVAERAGSSTVELEMDLARKENENGKLKASIELMTAAVARARQFLHEGLGAPSAVAQCGLGTKESPASGTKKSPASGTKKSPASGTKKSPASGTKKSPASGTRIPFMRRFCCLCSRKQKENHEELAEVTIDPSAPPQSIYPRVQTSETNPPSVPDSPLSS